MSASIEALNGLERRLTINIPAEQVEKAYQDRLNKVAKTAKMPGFRVGKVPKKLLESRYGAGIREEIANELVNSSVKEAIEANELQVAGAPRMESSKPATVGEALECVVSLEVYPKIALQPLTGEVVEKNRVEISEKDIDNQLELVRQSHAEWVVVDRAVVTGDRVRIDFKGTIDGLAFERGEAKDFLVEIGSKKMIPGFEEGIVGLKLNESRDIDVDFPSDYPSPELAGKKATFHITVNEISEPKLPEINDAFLEKLQIKSEDGIQTLRNKIRETLEREVEKALHEQFKAAVLDKLIAKNSIEVPNALVEAEINHLQQMTRRQIVMQGHDPKEADKIQLPRDPYKDQAKRRVILGLLLAEVIKSHKIQVDQASVRQHIEKIAASYQQPEQVISWYYNNKQMLSEIEAVVLEDQAISRLLTELTVEEKLVSYEEVLKQQPQGEI